MDADLQLGRHREVVGELEALTAERPMHEGFHAQLLVAAYRCGHRREALNAYQRLRSTMIFVLAFLVLGLTCSMVHCWGFFSGRQRRNLVPWRKRPPEK